MAGTKFSSIRYWIYARIFYNFTYYLSTSIHSINKKLIEQTGLLKEAIVCRPVLYYSCIQRYLRDSTAIDKISIPRNRG